MRRGGYTLIELLVAAAVLGVLLLLASSLTVQAARAGATIGDAAQREQIRSLARELLRQQLQQATYGPEATGDGGPELQLRVQVGGAAAGGDVLEVSYLDGRWTRTPQPETIRLEARRDSRRIWNLYLQEQGATRQPAVQEVNGIRILSFATPEGPLPPSTPLPLQSTGVELEISFTWEETSNVFIPFRVPIWIRSLG